MACHIVWEERLDSLDEPCSYRDLAVCSKKKWNVVGKEFIA